ncbi:ring canal kelch homolog [Acyrthosiphon pisum]|uniref:Kelch-like protein diablo n=1 Tax=Acyrthosiphon pisum TaxID=7029 RepID=A0A8R1W9P6_ACYPI|nr:ring canal kelch homolog [Acyrthosiphon pisum]XP_016663969.1 ring canal kelch homolog [Acyrthosiphon pisum]|eukprot:XP_003247935.1 PREDICTED: ring canal kelch homolog [Acyrthosiphon pisum]
MQNTKQIPEPSKWEPKKYVYSKSSYAEIFKVLQSLRKDEIFCDIKLETDDGTIIYGHKVVLASACQYFHAMFTNFEEKDQDLVAMRQLDSSALQLLVNFIYSGKILVTEKNVQVLLSASNLLQLQEVKDACCDFLKSQLCPKNCIDINALADLYNCTELLTSSELYIQQHFSEVVEGDEFLSLSSEQVFKLISSDGLKVPSEENVFECVIRWVKHDLGSRKCILPQLMEHVRLPLTSKNYILTKVVKEPLINNCLKCKDYVIEALHFHLLNNSDDLIPFTQISRIKSRQYSGFDKVIFVVGGIGISANSSTEWYDPKINRWQIGPKMITPRRSVGLAVVKNNSVFAVGGFYNNSLHCSVDVLDLSSESPCWKPTIDMSVKRGLLGVGVIDNCVYAVGGFDGESCLNSVEVFDSVTQKWRMVSSMSTRRSSVGIGVLNNLLYAVGGYSGYSEHRLNCVECYHPSIDRWTPIAKMSVCRSAVGVGVLDGVMYAVGGYDGIEVHSSVEAYRPSTGDWTNIADMHLCRQNAGVVAFDGLLYVVGGSDGTSTLDSVEFYNPDTNTWTMVTATMNIARTFLGAVAIDRPRHFKI